MIEGTLLNAPMNIGLKTRETRRLSGKKKKIYLGGRQITVKLTKIRGG